MKQKDIALLILIGGISAIISVVLSNRLFTAPENRQQEVEIIEEISSTITIPSDQYFNSDSINPTTIIIIEPENNENIFN